MDFHLIVTEPFQGFAKGARIEDAEAIDDILNSESQDKVVRVPS